MCPGYSRPRRALLAAPSRPAKPPRRHEVWRRCHARLLRHRRRALDLSGERQHRRFADLEEIASELEWQSAYVTPYEDAECSSISVISAGAPTRIGGPQ
jgi:hypothetical protein